MDNFYEERKINVNDNNTSRKYFPLSCSTQNIKRLLLTICLLVLSTTLWSIFDIHINSQHQYLYGISSQSYQEGLMKCAAIKRERPNNFNFLNNDIDKNDKFKLTTRRDNNPRYVPGTKIYVITNAKILNGLSETILGDVVLKDGLIEEIGQDLQGKWERIGDKERTEVIVIDVKKKYVSPGLIDMHSHAGLDPWPYLKATGDINERTDPLTPYVRAKDGISPSDPSLRIISSGGVTTSLILPGSANLMGGEGYVIKLRPVDTLSIDDMGIYANVDQDKERVWRYLKMACGENPKNNYGHKRGMMPATRMGEAWLFRKRFAEAQKLKKQQDDWCDAAKRLSNYDRLKDRFPEDLQYESLVALLRGDVKLNVHCYETQDIEAIIRHSWEFDFNIAAIHHALDAYRIPDIIKRANSNITIALFSDLWGYKKEAFQASPRAPKILSDANIPVALKSDHPVTNSQHLMFEAAKAHHYGLDEKLSIAAVTSVPANALGLGHRIGQISVGYDADVVIWDSYPLTLGATPLEVYIDGIPQFNTDKSVLESEITPKSQILKNAVKNKNNNNNKNDGDDVVKSSTSSKSRTTSSIIIKNVGKVYIDENNVIDASHSLTEEEKINILVKDGLIECIGINCTTSPDQISAYEVIDLNNGYVLPGIIAVGSNLGLSEIDAEEETKDGTVNPISKPYHYEDIIYAVDGLKLGGKHLEVAYKAGVLTAITAPLSKDGVLTGISVAFKTGARTVLDLDPENGAAILNDVVALHAQVGTSFKNEKIPTISGQIAFLRKVFKKFLGYHSCEENIFCKVLQGEIPLIVHTHSKDEIASLIKLKDLIKRRSGNLRLVISGGSEAHHLAAELSRHNIPVILLPPRPVPDSWTAQNVLVGAPLTNNTGIDILYANKVLIGIGVDNPGLAKNLAWDAGWVQLNSRGLIPEKDAVGFITWNLEKIFGLNSSNGSNRDNVNDYDDDDNVNDDNDDGRLVVKGRRANFVAYDGNPFEMGTRVRVVAGGKLNEVLIDPEQD